MNASAGKGVGAEINVTPLIDVLLVLLIIFMVVLPQAPSGMPAAVPQPSQHQPDPAPSDPIVVEVSQGADGVAQLRINGTEVAKGDLRAKLTAIFAAGGQKEMFVKGGKELEFTEIAEVIDDAHRAGVTTVGIMTPASDARR